MYPPFSTVATVMIDIFKFCFYEIVCLKNPLLLTPFQGRINFQNFGSTSPKLLEKAPPFLLHFVDNLSGKHVSPN